MARGRHGADNEHTHVVEPAPHIRKIAFLGNDPPRKCGIATVTSDVLSAVAAQHSQTPCFAVPVHNLPGGCDYPDVVHFAIEEKNLASNQPAAEFVNMSNADVVCVQHEFGIHGGPTGDPLLALPASHAGISTPSGSHTARRDLRSCERARNEGAAWSRKSLAIRTLDLALRELPELFNRTADPKWSWFEDLLAYDNAKLAHALIVSGRATGQAAVFERRLRALRRLVAVQTAEGGDSRAIGSNGFCPRGGPRAGFDWIGSTRTRCGINLGLVARAGGATTRATGRHPIHTVRGRGGGAIERCTAPHQRGAGGLSRQGPL